MKKRVNEKKSFAGRTLAVALAAMLTLSLCACGETVGGSGNGQSGTQDSNAQTPGGVESFESAFRAPVWKPRFYSPALQASAGQRFTAARILRTSPCRTG